MQEPLQAVALRMECVDCAAEGNGSVLIISERTNFWEVIKASKARGGKCKFR